MNVAVIPARGGSKRIPRKNVKLFCGKPMIVWSIEAALESGCFDRVVVSTDDAEIAEVARQHGAETPFMRPSELSDDYATTVDVMRHAAEWLVASKTEPDFLCCIYATAPFLQADDLARGLVALRESDAPYAFSVTHFAFPVQRALRIDSRGRIGMLFPQHEMTRSQDLEPTFHDAGQFYWGRLPCWLSGSPILTAGALPIELPRDRVQDIDGPDDWRWCERLHQVLFARNLT